MGRYDDLRRLAATVLAKMRPSAPGKMDTLRSRHGNLPDDYNDFLTEIGYGVLGEDSFVFYSGPTDPVETYGVEFASQLDGILLFGDDMQGYCYGFRAPDMKIVEVDPNNKSLRVVADKFEDFVRKRVNQAL